MPVQKNSLFLWIRTESSHQHRRQRYNFTIRKRLGSNFNKLGVASELFHSQIRPLHHLYNIASRFRPCWYWLYRHHFAKSFDVFVLVSVYVTIGIILIEIKYEKCRYLRFTSTIRQDFEKNSNGFIRCVLIESLWFSGLKSRKSSVHPHTHLRTPAKNHISQRFRLLWILWH